MSAYRGSFCGTCLAGNGGVTFLMAVFMVMIIGILSASTGKSWSLVMKREREKELLFRGSQIKEAIENWYDPKYSVGGARKHRPIPLTDLKFLVEDQLTAGLTKIYYLPHGYAAKLDDKDARCAPDCATHKIYQDPMTGKPWTLIRGSYDKNTGQVTVATGDVQGGGIIGIASRSDEAPIRTDFKDTALENMGAVVSQPPPATVAGLPHGSVFTATPAGEKTTPPPAAGAILKKYSEWRFIADPKNDHAKLYRSYREGW